MVWWWLYATLPDTALGKINIFKYYKFYNPVKLLLNIFTKLSFSIYDNNISDSIIMSLLSSIGKCMGDGSHLSYGLLTVIGLGAISRD